MSKSMTKQSLSGHWRIVWMALWDQEYVDLIEPGYIKLMRKAKENFSLVLLGDFLAM
ncbi:hypothetical protein [Piscirickettsia salmonis]|uniref:Uncharacterized protein n=1 Tax=Piscirickettsia salmonis TaxID=1238 RepID=A0A9Q6LL77_PISSA|nr:hypothetical protein [Piscirickettsia salmonis]ALA25811.1 hypothetical protein KW89_2349 [Piscirickettsia salmonis]ERL62603.1 hypothetical protein K661_01039 [Piscirickettsia salmonis LF-89 = ATCC VR-1361]QGN78253.1 hypothetical protein Psal001_02489 [Piscirickettsia salmonis]QGN81834.1 hypothetical protein Psal002_02505 [Piscirickettsia salmonis]QGN83893.1 hypothetical protein Psal003_00926 [Piscirickettsia salmonis]